MTNERQHYFWWTASADVVSLTMMAWKRCVHRAVPLPSVCQSLWLPVWKPDGRQMWPTCISVDRWSLIGQDTVNERCPHHRPCSWLTIPPSVTNRWQYHGSLAVEAESWPINYETVYQMHKYLIFKYLTCLPVFVLDSTFSMKSVVLKSLLTKIFILIKGFVTKSAASDNQLFLTLCCITRCT